MLIVDRIFRFPSTAVDLFVKCLLGAFAIYAGALISFDIPGSPVPVTLQTLGVLLVGAYLGHVRAGLAVSLYLLAGLIGLPVFAKGNSGLEVFLGGSGGFLIGFLLASVVVGALVSKGWLSGIWRPFLLFLWGHATILIPGYVWLAYLYGASGLLEKVFLPLMPGLLIKTAVAVLLTKLLMYFCELKR